MFNSTPVRDWSWISYGFSCPLVWISWCLLLQSLSDPSLWGIFLLSLLKSCPLIVIQLRFSAVFQSYSLPKNPLSNSSPPSCSTPRCSMLYCSAVTLSVRFCCLHWFHLSAQPLGSRPELLRVFVQNLCHSLELPQLPVLPILWVILLSCLICLLYLWTGLLSS